MSSYQPTSWINDNYPEITKNKLQNIENGIMQGRWYGTTTNSGNNYSVSLTPAPTSYYDGMSVSIKINSDSTDNSTININNLGIKNIKDTNGDNINYLKSNMIYSIVYNGTDFILQNSMNSNIVRNIYGIKIDKNDSNPATRVTYTDDSIGMTGANGNNGSFSWGDWENEFPFNQIKPCVFKNGIVQYYLNKNDFTKKEDNSNADIVSGDDGDVMIEFPKLFWYISEDADYVYIRYANNAVDSNYKALAHTVDTDIKDKIYIGAFLGYKDNNDKLRSLADKDVSVSLKLNEFRNYANNMGLGYCVLSYYPLLMVQILFTVMFKSTASRVALGTGWTGTKPSPKKTGEVYGDSWSTLNVGMNYGKTDNSRQLKLFGMEDFWGNYETLIDGIVTDNNQILISNQLYFNNHGIGYTSYPYTQPDDTEFNDFIKEVQAGQQTGFLLKKVDTSGGTSTTYYTDFGYVKFKDRVCLLSFGTSYQNLAKLGGVYSSLLGIDNGYESYVDVTCRLMYVDGGGISGGGDINDLREVLNYNAILDDVLLWISDSAE